MAFTDARQPKGPLAILSVINARFAENKVNFRRKKLQSVNKILDRHHAAAIGINPKFPRGAAPRGKKVPKTRAARRGAAARGSPRGAAQGASVSGLLFLNSLLKGQ